MYFHRKIDTELKNWAAEANRKPLLLRGARQVGKSSAVKNLSLDFNFYLEVNFDANPLIHQLFTSGLSPREIADNLSVIYDTPVVEGKTLIFFDEIQACIPAISMLRYFYEKWPEIHLIAAGSLLGFALEELPSFGVGRVRSMFVYPFTFDDFLLACGQESLLQAKQKAHIKGELNELIHSKLLSHLKKFIILGGMPETVSCFVSTGSLRECQRVLDDLILSYQADFAKYKKKVPVSRLREVFDSVVHQNGSKFSYSKLSSDSNAKQIKEALNLLIMAGLVIPVTHTAANGLPLGAEVDLRKRKMLVLDTGLFQRMLALKLDEVLLSHSFEAINKGNIAELFVGLELLKSGSCYQQNNLYYWHREATNSNAEVDYVVQSKSEIVPIEVKAGKKGSMQSMYLFLNEKNSKMGLRLSTENYGSLDSILIRPLYAVSDFLELE